MKLIELKAVLVGFLLIFTFNAVSEVLETLRDSANRPYSGFFVEILQRKSPDKGGTILVVRQGNFCKSAIHEPKVCKSKAFKKGVLRVLCTTDASKFIELSPDAKGHFRLNYKFTDVNFYSCAGKNGILKFNLAYFKSQFAAPVSAHLLTRDALLRALSKKPLASYSIFRVSSAEANAYLNYYNKLFAAEIKDYESQQKLLKARAAKKKAGIKPDKVAAPKDKK